MTQQTVDPTGGWYQVVMNILSNDWTVATLCAIAGQVAAVVFGEVLKMRPGFFERRAGEWKWDLRTYPIVAGAVATFVLIYAFLDISIRQGGGWIMLALLNGAMAWPLYDKLYAPLILPGIYRRIAKVFKFDQRIAAKEESGEDLSAAEQTVKDWAEKKSGGKKP